MREILFRGKRIDSGEWVEGYYVYLEARKMWSHRIYTGYAEVDVGDFYPDFFEVNPATIAQYTGLTDKNGARVFEGDILQIAKKSDALGIYFFPPVQYPINVVVKWDLCAWVWEVQGKEGPYYIHFPDAWCHYECKVIGNIHDNLELLEGD